MREYNDTIVAKIERTFVRLVCDLCGRETEHPYFWPTKDVNQNEVKISVEVKQSEGISCPDGGSGTELEIDLCPGCFKDRLVPWLESQGAKLGRKEWDW